MPDDSRLPTLWAVPDDLWDRIELVLAELDPPASTGRPRVDQRRVFDGIIYHLRTGCQWNHIPDVYGDDSTIHRTFQKWTRLGVFARLWALLIGECAEGGRVDWHWQAADTALGKARMGGTPSARTRPIGPRTEANGAC